MIFDIILISSVFIIYFGLGLMLANDMYIDGSDLFSAVVVMFFWLPIIIYKLLVEFFAPIVVLFIPRWYMKERSVEGYVKFFIVRQWFWFCWNKEMLNTKLECEERLKQLRGVK